MKTLQPTSDSYSAPLASFPLDKATTEAPEHLKLLSDPILDFHSSCIHIKCSVSHMSNYFLFGFCLSKCYDHTAFGVHAN